MFISDQFPPLCEVVNCNKKTSAYISPLGRSLVALCFEHAHSIIIFLDSDLAEEFTDLHNQVTK